MNEQAVIAALRAMYRTQHETDENGGREVAAWYYLDQLEAAAGVTLFDDCPAGGAHVPVPNSDAAPMPFTPGWHCGECGASLPSPDQEEP